MSLRISTVSEVGVAQVLGEGTYPAPNLFWYDATVGVVTSGANVTTWEDQSGNGYDIPNYPGFPPQYDADGWDGSLPAIMFPGPFNAMQVGGPLGSYPADNLGIHATMVAVVEPTLASSSRCLFNWTSTPVNQVVECNFPYYDGAQNVIELRNLATWVRSATPVSAGKHVAVWEVFAHPLQGIAVKLFVDGELHAEGPFPSLGGATDKFIIGCNSLGFFPYIGKIAELQAWNFNLSAIELGLVREELIAKWDL